MDSALTASDVALLNNDGFGGNNSVIWLFALLALFSGGFGWGGNRGDFGNYATASSQTEILLGQQFDRIGQAVNSIGNGIADATYALNEKANSVQTVLGGAIVNEGRAIQTQLCAINSNIDNKFAALEKSQLEQKIAEQSQAISQLQTQQMLCGIPRVNNDAWGIYAYPRCGYACGNNNI